MRNRGIKTDEILRGQEAAQAGRFPGPFQAPKLTPEEMRGFEELAKQMARRKQGGLQQLLAGLFQR